MFPDAPFHLCTPNPQEHGEDDLTVLWAATTEKWERRLLKISWETTAPCKRCPCIFNRPYAGSIMLPQLAGLVAAACSAVLHRVPAGW